jgi:hypothetical protein
MQEENWNAHSPDPGVGHGVDVPPYDRVQEEHGRQDGIQIRIGQLLQRPSGLIVLSETGATDVRPEDGNCHSDQDQQRMAGAERTGFNGCESGFLARARVICPCTRDLVPTAKVIDSFMTEDGRSASA